jgi:hypothetical protein
MGPLGFAGVKCSLCTVPILADAKRGDANHRNGVWFEISMAVNCCCSRRQMPGRASIKLGADDPYLAGPKLRHSPTRR